MKNDGTPLPATLDGIIGRRLIQVDTALFYLIGGILAQLVEYQKFEQTGTLTPDEARAALSQMLWDFYHEDVPVDSLPIGAVLQWIVDTAPAGWLLCDGSSHLRADYPALSAIIPTGSPWDGGSLTFVVPDLRDRFPVGIGTIWDMGNQGGEMLHTLTVSEIPSHRHGFTSATGAGAGLYPVRGTSTVASSGHLTAFEGGGAAHNNMPPFTALNFIVRAE